ncbi:hypothetical protein [Aurantiacibacter spongiae]|uniref:Uncharacterized protein n=1 Tax=Aurantiacibacter spongiae TaxID=2488860 RepID=A0A3N5CSE2_9SPHN|nr:hypothetical protein [Aurantiacibacter spongiae]RPF72054.1 hypothetical protein EG799_10830 [Aurantiacibacter spongiae]
MTPHYRIRRIGWLAALGVCLVLYAMLHLKVNALHSEVVRAEREIVSLENENMLLETEFLTRSNQVQLAAWNRVDFGFEAPTAQQFIESPRQLARFGSPREADAPAPIRLAGMSDDGEMPAFPRLVSPLTGKPVEADVLGEGGENHAAGGGHAPANHLAVSLAGGPVRVAIGGIAASAGR